MTTARVQYGLAIGLALGTAVFLVLSSGALGIIGAGGRPDLMYAGALAVGVVGAVVARFRARGMAVALAATAIATVLVAFVAIAAGLHRNEGASALDILAISGMFAGLFGLSAWLFSRAARP
jgi:hypothetical protein